MNKNFLKKSITQKKRLFVLLSVLLGHLAVGQNARKAHFGATLIDTHNDILTTIATDGVNIDDDLSGKTHSDLARFKKGGVDVQIFSVWCDGNMKNPFAWANGEIDSLYAIANRNPEKMEIAYSAADLKRILKKKKFAAMIGVEGGHMIEDDLSKLDSLYKRGARYMTLTWNNSTSWATSAMEETNRGDSLNHKGLTDFGKRVVKRMNELGMMVDVSHVGEQTFWDAINATSKPVIASHSDAHTLCPVFRNLKDDQIKAVGKNRGVICLNFYSGFLDSTFNAKRNAFNQRHIAERDSLLKTVTDPYFADTYLALKYRDEVEGYRAPFHLLLDHLDYIVKLIGSDHVGIGSDFDGISSPPQMLDGVEDFPKLTAAMLERGYSKKEIRKILGGNVLRVFTENQK
ncbi:MAG: membrane dipeptidase [Bacteroidia bacterium]|nr:membrane dipeptidase [Bacteroidia bacterium]